MDLEFTINNQILKRTDSNKLVDWSDNYLKLVFGFETDDWNELTKFALFKHNGETVRLPLVDDAVTLPDELLTGDRLFFSLYGVNSDDFRITTNQVKLLFSRSGFTTDTSDIDELPTVITVLDEIYFAINSKVSQAEYDVAVTDLSENKADKVEVETELGTKANITYVDSEISDLNTSLLQAISEIDLIIIVDELPTTDIKNNKIYLVLNGESIEHNRYDVYVRVNNEWEELDSLEFNITDYAKKTDFHNVAFTGNYNQLNNKPTKVSEFANDSGYLTEHQSLAEYYTKTVIDDLLDKIDNKLTLKTDKTIIESGDTLNFIAQAKRDGFPVGNVTVTFYEVNDNE